MAEKKPLNREIKIAQTNLSLEGELNDSRATSCRSSQGKATVK